MTGVRYAMVVEKIIGVSRCRGDGLVAGGWGMPSFDRIAPGEIHLHIVDDSEVADLDACRAVMSADEHARSDRFHFERDRRRFAVTRGLLRFTLSLYVPDSRPDAWRFGRNRHGRPAIAGDGGGGLDFNLSHTAGRAVLAVSRLRSVGVDVEWRGRSLAAADLAARFFAAEEAAALPTEPAARDRRFFELWTLKEAYVKALGKGLSIPLDSFHIGFPGESGLSLEIDGRSAAGWRLWALDAGRDHALAVAAMADETVTLRAFRSIPAVSADAADCRVLRSL